jgi:hypothetical protein
MRNFIIRLASIKLAELKFNIIVLRGKHPVGEKGMLQAKTRKTLPPHSLKEIKFLQDSLSNALKGGENIQELRYNKDGDALIFISAVYEHAKQVVWARLTIKREDKVNEQIFKKLIETTFPNIKVRKGKRK